MLARVTTAVGLACAIAACNGDDDPDEASSDDASALPDCINFDTAGCDLLYEPTFDNVYAQTLLPTCATMTASCHSDAQSPGAVDHDLFFAGAADSHMRLLQDRGDETFVRANDPSCGVLSVRLRTDDEVLRMPSGSMLLDTEICSVLTWIANGALP